jgi:uncharacterized protein
VPVPPLRARVTDLTATLAPDQRAALEQRLAALETAKGSQVAILMVPTVQPEAIEQYAIRVFDQWKLGRKGIDDGVLLLVAKNDRKLRIEVGRGLEGAIPDAYAKRIIDEEITPRFKQGDFYGGVSAGVERIARLVQGEPMPPPKARPAAPGFGFGLDAHGLFVAFIVLIVFTTVLHSLLGRALGSGVVGVAAGFFVYAIAGVLAVAAIVGVVVFVFSLFMGTGPGRGSGWSSGGWSSGGGGFGGGGGGGGFSGGGGGSSGGGASGSW